MVNNTKYGSGALENNSGTNNTAVGAYASYNNLDASNNTAIGSNTAFFNTTGSNNTSLGAGSLCNNTTGSLNTAIGSSALEGTSGSVGNQNTAIGAQSLYTIKGNQNTAIGAYSGLGVTGGNYNTFLGANSSTLNNTSYDYSTAIGYNAIIDASNEIMMGGLNSGNYPNVIIPGKAFLSNFVLTGLQEDQIVPKSYIDLVSGGLKATETCICATTANISFTGVPPSSSTDGVNLSTLSDGSYNILVINQNGATNTPTLDVSNGVWVFRKQPGPIYSWSRPVSPAPMYVGYDAVGAFSFIQYGTTYGSTGLVQTYQNSSDLAIVGTDPLKYQIFYQLQFNIGRGLSTQMENITKYLNVDTSLNFVNFLDSNASVDPSANGTLALGTNTTNKIVIGPTGTSVPIQAQSIIQAQQGITGTIGSFNQIIAGYPQGIYVTRSDNTIGHMRIVSDGSNNFVFTNISGNRAFLFNSGDMAGSYNFKISDASNNSIFSTSSRLGGSVGINNSVPSYHLDVSGNARFTQGITGPTGSFTYLTGMTGTINYLNSKNNMLANSNTLITTSGGIPPYPLTGTITGFDLVNPMILASTAAETANHIEETTLVVVPNQTTGSNMFGSYYSGGYLQGTGNAYGSFGVFNDAGGVRTPTLNTYFDSTKTCFYKNVGVNLGNTGPSYNLDVSGNARITGGITGATGSFSNLYVSTKALFAQDISVNTLSIGLGSGNMPNNIAIGVRSLQLNTSGGANTSIGYQALQQNTNGQYNTALGLSSLTSNTSGMYNTGVGAASLSNNTNGESNTAVGFQSLTQANSFYNTGLGANTLFSNTSGGYNTAVGFSAGSNNTTFSNSTALGANAQLTGSNQVMLGGLNSGVYPQVVAPGGITGPTGSFSNLITSQDAIINNVNIGLGGGNQSSNISIGYQSLQSNTTGLYNTSIGYQSLQSGITGTSNTSIGYQSLQNLTYTNTNAGAFTSVGYQALQNSTGVGVCTAVGFQALNQNTTGGDNTAIGTYSLLSNTTGQYNTSLGHKALINSTTSSYNTAVGNFNSQANTTGSNNTSLGANSLFNNTIGSNNTAIGSQALSGITGTSNNTALGYSADVSGNYSNSTAIGANAKSTASNQVMLGGLNSGVYPQVVAPGGITGPTGSFSYLSSSQRFSAPGGITGTNANFSGTVTATTVTQTSDYRIKENVIPLDDKFIVDSLIPVTYKNKLTEKQDMGLIAHEVQKIYPFLVNGEKDGEEFQSVNYTSLIAVLIKEIKELKQRVKILEDK